MATITATLNLSSPDITGDPLNLSKTATLTKAGSNTGLDQFTGVTTVVYSAAQTAANIVPAASYVDTTVSHKVYIRNTSTGNSDYILVELEDDVIVGRLYPGDWMFIPYLGVLNVEVTTLAVGVGIEYGVFSQSTVS